MDNEKICRTCAKKENCTNLLTFLFSEEAENLDLRGKLTKYTPVELHENDDLPKSICGECKTRIADWHLFWDNCLKIEHSLKRIRDSLVEEKNTSVETINELARNNQPEIENTNVGTSNVQENSVIDSVQYKKQTRGVYCIARWCNSNNAVCKMFRIPKDQRCHVWLTRAGREDLKSLNAKQLQYKYLCEKHFTDKMFNNSKKNRLNWDALPTVFEMRNQSSSVSSPKDTVSGSGQLRLRNLRTLLAKPSSPRLKSSPVNHQQDLYPIPIQYPLKVQQQDSNKVQHVLVLNTSGLENQDKVVELEHSVFNNTLLENLFNNSTSILKKQAIQNDDNITAAGCSRDTDAASSSATKKHSRITVTEDSIWEPECSVEVIEPSVVTKKQETVPKTKVLNPCNIVLVDSLENLKESDVDSLCSGFRECMYPCLACGEVFLMKSSLAQHRKTYHDYLSTY